MGILKDKKALIFGVANERSIAYAIAEKFSQEGAEVIITFLNKTFEKRIKPLAEKINARVIGPCDVTKDEELDSTFEQLKEITNNIDIMIHSLAFANKDDLANRFVQTTRENYWLALNISAYSFIELSRRTIPFMKNGGAILTLTYYGSEKVVKNYNVMGVAKAALESSVRYLASDLGGENIRVNAISAGPVKTLAASGIKGFHKILNYSEELAPLKRNITQEEIAKAALFLCSDLASGITGEIMFVDAGMNILGVGL